MPPKFSGMGNKSSRAFGSYQMLQVIKAKEQRGRACKQRSSPPLRKLRRSELSHLSQVHPVSHWGPVYTKVATGLFNQTPAISQKKLPHRFSEREGKIKALFPDHFMMESQAGLASRRSESSKPVLNFEICCQHCASTFAHKAMAFGVVSACV